ncbi:MAG: T9SS type A sorting domain-containing protein [Salinibacter sp.]
MAFRLASVVLLTGLLLGTGAPSPSRAQERPRLPSHRHQSLRAPAAVPLQTRSFSGADALRREDARRRDDLGPYRYGKNLETQYIPAQHGVWEQLPSGDWVWRLRIRSPDAKSLSVGLPQFRLPDGAALFLHGANDGPVRGPYTAADATRGQLWTPLVRSETITLELTVPQGRRDAVDLVVGTLVHGYRALSSSPADGLRRKSGACNLDVACEDADPWRKQVRSVGGYTFGTEDFHLVCSGALVNNTTEDGRPLFLTAEHCVQTPEQAASMVFYWNFQTSTCRTPGTPENGTFPSDTLSVTDWRQTSTGALLRARYGSFHSTNSIAGKPDLALVEVDDAIPDGYNLYLSGWSRAGRPPQSSVTIHHPAGHGKRISFDRDPTALIDYPSTRTCTAPSGDTHLLIRDWEVGTTEAGSSGAPLFNTNQRIVGVLSGGCAGCGGDGDADDNDAPDWYGRLAPGFQKGDYTPPGASQPTTLADVLDPLGTGTPTLGGRPLGRDTIPPAPVPTFEVATVTPDSVTLRWSATGDDGAEGTAQRYDLRYRTDAPITSLTDFRSARRVADPPRPKTAGTRQSATIAVNQSTSYYFAIRAVDDAEIVSPLVATDRDVTPVAALRVTTPPSPNPTRERTTLRFVVEQPQAVRAALYDALGRRVTVLLDKEVPAFRRQRITADVSGLASGVYFLRIRGETAARTERVSVVK